MCGGRDAKALLLPQTVKKNFLFHNDVNRNYPCCGLTMTNTLTSPDYS